MTSTTVAGRTRVHSFGDDALADHDAVALVAQVRSGKVSAAEIVEAAVGRAEKLQPELDAVAYQAFDRARFEAANPRPGWFSGVPTFVKDNVDVAGMPTQQGSRAWVARPAKADGDWARMFLGTGLVVLGKTRLSEFGFNASAEYPEDDPVANPWHTGYTSGASSAGSAAFVGAGVVPIAHANDGGGSIRIPAACCGLVGLKPTRGRTPSDKRMREMPVKIVADGVLTRSVRDTAAFYREAEKVYRDLELPPIGDIRGPVPKRLRVAVVTDSVGGRRIDPECVLAVHDVAALLEGEGHRTEIIDPPLRDSFAGDFSVYWAMLAAVTNATGRFAIDRRFDRSKTDNLTRGLAQMCRKNAYRLPFAIARLQASQRDSRRLYKKYDVVLSPVLGHPTPQLGHLRPDQPFEEHFERLLEWVAFTPLQNATGDPAISLPTAMSGAGTPIGVQFATRLGGEATLIELAYEIEAARPFARIQD
ncbi:MAG: amidase [Marmoricola sp.]